MCLGAGADVADLTAAGVPGAGLDVTGDYGGFILMINR
jgi:hypothetical protein